MYRAGLTTCTILVLVSNHAFAAPKPGSFDETLLTKGIHETALALRAAHAGKKGDAQFQFELGLCEFLEANQVLLQDIYRYGFRSHENLIRNLKSLFSQSRSSQPQTEQNQL